MGSWLLITQTSDYAFATFIIVPNKVAGVKVPLTPKSFFLLKKSTNFPFPFSEKIISIDKIFAFLQAFEHAIVHDGAKWDLGRATSDVTSGTELRNTQETFD